MATTFIRVTQTGGAPEDYLVSGATDIDMLSCSAHFNGSSAGADFYPAIQVLDEAGQVAATVVGPKVTAGDSVDVTFAPFLEQPTAAAPPGGGIQFDTFPQAGNWLYVETDNSSGSPGPYGTQFRDFSAVGSDYQAAFGELLLAGTAAIGDGVVLDAQQGLTLQNRATGRLKIRSTAQDGQLLRDSYSDIGLGPGSGIVVQSDDFGVEIDAGTDFSVNTGGNVFLGLPTVNPGISGALWNNAGVVTVSP